MPFVDLVSNEIYGAMVYQDLDTIIFWTLDAGASQPRESAVTAAQFDGAVIWPRDGVGWALLQRFQLVGDDDAPQAALARRQALDAYAAANGGQVAVHTAPDPAPAVPSPGLMARTLAIFTPKP